MIAMKIEYSIQTKLDGAVPCKKRNHFMKSLLVQSYNYYVVHYLFLRLLWKSPSSERNNKHKLHILLDIGKTVGIEEESINRNETCL